MIKNKILQFVYYRIIKKIIPKDEFNENDFFNSYGRRFLWQGRIAKLLDKNFIFLFGDSEIEGMADEKYMSEFAFVICNFGKGGSKPYQLLYFLKRNRYGKKLYKIIKNNICIISTGGNSLWHGEIENIEEEFLDIKKFLPMSMMLTLPPIDAKLLEGLTKGTSIQHSEKYFNKTVNKINSLIKKIWGDFIFDLNKILTNQETQRAYWFALKDPIHYSEYTEKLFRIFVKNFFKGR